MNTAEGSTLRQAHCSLEENTITNVRQQEVKNKRERRRIYPYMIGIMEEMAGIYSVEARDTVCFFSVRRESLSRGSQM